MALLDTIAPFLWGEGGSKTTPEQVKRQREIAQALLQTDTSPVGHWTQGLARVADAAVGAYGNYRSSEQEKAGREGFQSQWDSVFGGGQSAPVQTAALDPVAAALVGTPQTASDAANAMGDGFLSSLVSSESGGNWNALNSEGYGGRLQFGDARLADAAKAGIIPAGMTGAAFSRLPPEQQQAVEAWHFADIDQQAANMGLNSYVGQTVGGAPITQESIRAMAHLGGIGGAQKFLESGGQYNPADSNGTSLLDYALKHGGAGAGGGTASPLQMAQSPDMAALLGLASDPWANDSQKQILQALMGQQMQQQDPMYQLQMQAAQQGLTKGELEIAQLLNPPAPEPIEVGGVLLDPSTMQPIFDSRQPTDGGFTLSPGQQRFDAQGNPIATGGPEPDKAPTVQKVTLADGSEMAVQWDGASQAWVPINAPQGGGNLQPDGLTESQSKLTLFQTLQTETQPVLLDLESQFNPANLQDAAARSTPIAGNFFQSEQGQIYNASASAWAEGALRIATGAAATPEEMQRTLRTYFAQPGDTPNTIAFKSQMREMYNRAINNSLGQSGEGSLPLPSEFAQKVGTGQGGSASGGQQSQPRVISQQDYQSLPSGSPFIAADDPTRTVRIKP